ncbi:hypothetical protein C8T65DRAFT_743360 [Cerioporus squamosus]|nr:hypothetical protein C8T65DRAFT_743360 [Cerioporus squamosus]
MSEEGLIPVINLPDPKPAVTARKDGGPAVPTVPDDIVREVSTLLDFNDRLALSLISHHVHEVVQPRLEEVTIRNPKLLAQFHKWVFENPVVRATQLRVLRFNTRLNSQSVRCCLEIIKKATKLEVLSCSSSLLEALPTPQLQAFTNLRHLQLRECTPNILNSLRLPTTLTRLHLSHPPSDTVFIFCRILHSITHLQALTTLVLEGFTLPHPDEEEDYDGEENDSADEDEDAEEGSDEDEDADGDVDGDADHGGDDDEGDGGILAKRDKASSTTVPVLTSLHTLKLIETDLPPNVAWTTTLPALRTVSLYNSMHFDSNAYATKPLQHLIIGGSFGGDPVPWSINRLTCDPAIAFPGHDPGLAILDDTCDCSELVALSLKLMNMSSSVWNAVTTSASDVRLLEIECQGVTLPEVIWLFYDLLRPDLLLDPVPLLCLSIVAALPILHQKPEEREQCQIQLLDRAFKALPSLRYLSLAEPPDDSQRMLPYKEEYAGNGAPPRWWRVVRDEEGSPIEIKEIPGWEGERVRSYLRNADREAAEHFHDKFVALR